MGEPSRSSTSLPHPHTHPAPLLHTHLTRLSTLSHTHLPPIHTLSHFPISPHSFPHTFSHLHPPPSPTLIPPDTFPLPSPKTSSYSLPTLSHNSHASSNTFPYSPYFIIYPIPKFLTLLIYCQISLTIKWTRNSL